MSNLPKIYVLNGPNLAALGSRQPEIYGSLSLAQIAAELQQLCAGKAELIFNQTDDEAEIIAQVYEAKAAGAAVIINPAAFTHYSYALRDALVLLRDAGLIVLEVHISNPYSREDFRRHSVTAPMVTGQISGLGADSYKLALAYVLERI